MQAPRRGRSSLKLVGSQRGDGVLVADSREFGVTYSVDWFADAQRKTGSGQLDGELAELTLLVGDEVAYDAVLRLSDGVEVAVTITDVEADGASFDTR